MTERYDVVVVGGGLLGCLTAWMAARDGAHVLLVDKDQVNQHASGQNAGSLHFQLEYRMVEAGEEAARVAAEAMPLHLDAAAMWARMEDEIGEPLGVRQTGGLMVAENSDQVGMLEFKAELERSWGLDVRTLDRTELDDVAPYLSRDIVAANLSALEGKADARIAAPAVGRAAIAAGATVRARSRLVGARRVPTGWEVTLRETDRAGDERARTVQTGAVVLAAGVWTTELGRVFDAELPTVPLALTMTVTSKIPRFIPHLVQHAGARLSLKQSLDNTVLIGGGWPARLMRDAHGAPAFDRKHQLIPQSIAGNARSREHRSRAGAGPRRAQLGRRDHGGTRPAAARRRGQGRAGGIRCHRRIGVHPRAELRAGADRPHRRALARYRPRTLRPGPLRGKERPMTTDGSWRRTAQERGDAVTIAVDGEPVRACRGETVAAAMLAAGAAFERDRIGAPRAPLCNMGTCFECAATVDGRPLTRTCLVPAREGLIIETPGRL